MPLPLSAQKQLEQADAQLAAVNAPPAPPVPTTPPAPPADPVAAQAPATPPAPAPVPPAPAPDTAEQRWRSLQGINQSLRTQNTELQTRLAALEARLAAPPAPAPTEAPKPTADPKDVEAFGLDMVSMVQRVTEQFLGNARQAIEQQFTTLRSEVAQLKAVIQGTSQSVQKTAEDLFFDKLAELVPQWQQINQDPAWLAFLGELDPIYGRPRQMALDEAQETGNAQRAAAIFKAFTGTVPPPPAAPPPESPSPRGAGAPPPPPPSQKPVFTQAQVTDFYQDVRRGRYRTQPQEAARLEAQFNAAMAEGRII